MIHILKKIFQNKKEHLSNDGCPNKCYKCGNKSIKIRRTLNKNKQPIKKYVSCPKCRINLATWQNNKWSY